MCVANFRANRARRSATTSHLRNELKNAQSGSDSTIHLGAVYARNSSSSKGAQLPNAILIPVFPTASLHPLDAAFFVDDDVLRINPASIALDDLFGFGTI